MTVRIFGIEYYLPENILTNADLEKEYPDWNAAKIENKIGIRERHFVKEDETALDLAFNAAQKILNNYNKNKIDFLLLCTQSPDYYLPTSACILQNRLELSTKTGALDFNLGCSGYIYGLALAKGLITSNVANSVLLITSETYTKFIHKKDRANRTIFGDGAAATIIEKTDKEGIFEFVLGTDGSGYKNLIVPNGGLRNKYNINAKEIIDETNNIRTDNNIYMNGPDIFNFTIEAVPKLFNETLSKNNLKTEDLDYVIFHQANKYMIEHLRKKLKIDENKFYINLLKTGNTVSSTIPIALKDCVDNKILKSGDKVLILGFGVGYSWSGTIVQI